GRRLLAAGNQSGLVVIDDAANLLVQKWSEDRVHEFENQGAAAKILRERNGLPGRGAPVAGVTAEDSRVGETEAINALLHIADQEAVPLRTLAAQRRDDAVLRCVDVLIFIHKHKTD